jgi:hypothetical protein
MAIAATRQLVYTLVRSPKADLWGTWVLGLGVRTSDGTVTDNKMSCEAHQFRSQANAVKWLRQKAVYLGISSLPERIGPTSVPRPLGDVIKHIR